MKYKQLVIAPEIFFPWFSNGEHHYNFEVIEGGMPKDAKLVNVWHDWPNAIRVLLESDEFEDVPNGEIIPELQLKIKTL